MKDKMSGTCSTYLGDYVYIYFLYLISIWSPFVALSTSNPQFSCCHMRSSVSWITVLGAADILSFNCCNKATSEHISSYTNLQKRNQMDWNLLYVEAKKIVFLYLPMCSETGHTIIAAQGYRNVRVCYPVGRSCQHVPEILKIAIFTVYCLFCDEKWICCFRSCDCFPYDNGITIGCTWKYKRSPDPNIILKMKKMYIYLWMTLFRSILSHSPVI
jgi:hypothetical protein